VRTAPATLGLLLLLAAPAAAGPTRLGTSITRPVVDAAAERVVWQPDAGSIRVLDLGAGQPARPLALPPACQPARLAGDRLLLDCADGSMLLDVAGGAAGPVPGWDAARAGAARASVLAVGRVWGEGVLLADPCCDAIVHFELASGRVDTGAGAANELPDLDSAALWRPMCAPLTRTPASEPVEQQSYLPYAYSPPLGLGYRAYDLRPLRVDRCGRERPLRLSRCRDACVAVRLGAGAVAWREHGRIRLYRGAGGARAEWRARAFGRRAEPLPTRAHVVVLAGAFGAYAVWSVRAPS
jgi:hypothetical protein